LTSGGIARVLLSCQIPHLEIGKIWRFAKYAFGGLLLIAYAWLVSRFAVQSPKRPLFFGVALLLLGICLYLCYLRGRRFLPIKIGFAACMILLSLGLYHSNVFPSYSFPYSFLFYLAATPFFLARPPRGPWWPAAKRTVRMFRGDSREDDAEHAAKILASFRQANTPQK